MSNIPEKLRGSVELMALYNKMYSAVIHVNEELARGYSADRSKTSVGDGSYIGGGRNTSDGKSNI